MIETNKVVRKPFYADAVEVTEANMALVAVWCGGEIKAAEKPRGRSDKYIQVPVQNPHNERQTMAFLGDHVLFANQGFKVYSNKAFEKTFVSTGDTMFVQTSAPSEGDVPLSPPGSPFKRIAGAPGSIANRVDPAQIEAAKKAVSASTGEISDPNTKVVITDGGGVE